MQVRFSSLPMPSALITAANCDLLVSAPKTTFFHLSVPRLHAVAASTNSLYSPWLIIALLSAYAFETTRALKSLPPTTVAASGMSLAESAPPPLQAARLNRASVKVVVANVRFMGDGSSRAPGGPQL